MAHTYSGDPSTSPKDQVRFILSDTRSDAWIFSDEEIAYTLSQQKSPYSAAAELALIAGSKYTDKRDKTVGPLSIKYGEIAKRWSELAASLRQRGGRFGGAVAILTQKPSVPYFRLGMHDNLQTPDPWYLDPRDVTKYPSLTEEEGVDGGDIG